MEWHLLTKWILRKIIFETVRNLQAVLSTLTKKLQSIEVHIVFDCYQNNSLEGNTMATCMKEYTAVHYKVSDATKMDHLEAKDF